MVMAMAMDMAMAGNLKWWVRRGEASSRAKLTDNDVLAIREKYQRRELTQQQLADLFKISRSAVGRIINREAWTHV
jgi:DNA-binding MarR family transcriptional regulator